MQRSGVKTLLMGGQACVLYGAAEFSRDTVFAILAEEENLARLQQALADLQAECIAVPPFEPQYLAMGLAIHFRCHHPEAEAMRVDIMSKMRGVAAFEQLWGRRSTFEVGDQSLEVMSLPDLVQAKKTQRDKDWPMLSRLVEVNYFVHREHPSPEQIEFWLRELRTPPLLEEVARRFPEACERLTLTRPVLRLISDGHLALSRALRQEEDAERDADRRYWEPLRKVLERLRKERRQA
jgi:hypothetical protein